MAEKIAIVFCALIFIILSLALLKKKNSKIVLSVDNVLILFFILFFGFLFPFDYFYSLSYSGGTNRALEVVSSFTASEMMFYYFCILVFLFPFILCFRYIEKRAGVSSPFDCHGQIDRKSNTFAIAVLLLMIGVIADRLYIQAYGSYANYLTQSSFIRSGASDFSNRFSFLIVFRGCVVLSSFLLFSTIRRRDSWLLAKILVFLFAFGYSLLIQYSNKGRLSMVLFLLYFPIAFFFMKRKPKYISGKILFMTVVLGAVFSVLVVWAGKLLSRSTNTNIAYAIASETAFPFENFKLLVSNKSLYEYRFFGDLLSYPLYFLPSSIWRNIMPYTASDICTILSSGAAKGTNGVYGETPCDLISIGFLQCNVFGVFVVAIIFGMAVGYIFVRVRSVKVSDFRLSILIYLTIYLSLHSVLYCDSYLVVQKMFAGVVLFLLIKFLSLVGLKLWKGKYDVADRVIQKNDVKKLCQYGGALNESDN